MDKWGREEKIYLGFLILLVLFISLFSFSVKANNSESPTDWRMFERDLNHTSWDHVSFTNTPGVNNGSVILVGNISSSPIIANGYVYAGFYNQVNSFFQFNASNVSQIIANFSAGAQVSASPAYWNGFIYLNGASSGGGGEMFYQLNASNISQKIANYSIVSYGSPAIVTIDANNTFVYIGDRTNHVYQFNASNISQLMYSYTTGAIVESSPAVATFGNNTFVYIGSRDDRTEWQLNASLVAQYISSFVTISGWIQASAGVYNGAVYVGDFNGRINMLNASAISQAFYYYYTGTAFDKNTAPVFFNNYVYFANKVFLQLNASNLSHIANFSVSDTITGYGNPTIYGNSIYTSLQNTVYQLNLSNVSQQIANLTTEGTISNIAAANGYIYFGNANGRLYQVNASNISLGNSLVCVEGWSCTGWGTCSGGTQTRICTDANSCGTIINRPTLSQSCTTSGGLPPNSTIPQQQTTETQNIGTITSGQSSSVSITNPSINIYNITINTNRNISGASITVSKKENENLPSTFPTGVIYQAFSINMTVNNANLNNVTMEFRVNKTWLDQQNYSYNDVILYRIPEQDNLWQALTTLSIREDNGYYYFSALSPGFSTFIIFIGMVECSPAETRCFNNELQSCAGNKTWTLKEQCQYGCENEKCSNIFSNLNINPNIIYTGIVLGVSVAVIIIFYLIVKNMSKKKSSKTSKKTFSKFYHNQSLHK